ncbi:MAG: acetylxylan esterase [Kiritimatiellales bacterium]
MRQKSLPLLLTLVTVMSSLAIADYSLRGNHDRPSPIYNPDEPMVFTVWLMDENTPVAGKKLKWVRTGDDGITQEGEAVSAAEGLNITASIEKPGFVRIYVTAFDEHGVPLTALNSKGKEAPIFFDGGACVAPDTLQGLPEPVDFDAYWKKQKEFLASVPLDVLEKKELPGNDNVQAFDMKIACAGEMPVSGILVMPKNAHPGSLPAEVAFKGYGVSGAQKRLAAGEDKIYFQINAHGIENNKPQDYYDNLKETVLEHYAFSQEENANPDTTYFHDMYLRVMRALQFVKSLPEWDGKNLAATGGSQGGMQSLVAAGLDPDVTSCYAWSPWCCDFGRTEENRLVGTWYIAYSPALEYYDPVNHVKRANPECKLSIVANLGDYVCPPSGVWIAYNNFPGSKTMEVRQGCEHGFTMKDYPKFVISDEKK